MCTSTYRSRAPRDPDCDEASEEESGATARSPDSPVPLNTYRSLARGARSQTPRAYAVRLCHSTAHNSYSYDLHVLVCLHTRQFLYFMVASFSQRRARSKTTIKGRQTGFNEMFSATLIFTSFGEQFQESQPFDFLEMLDLK